MKACTPKALVMLGMSVFLSLQSLAHCVTVTQTKLGNIFLTGEPPGFTLTGTGSSVDWTVSNYFGQVVASGNKLLSGPTSLQPGVSQPGYYEITLTEKSGSTVLSSTQTTFAIVVPVALSAASPFGVQTHFAQYNTADLMGILARGNISHLRDEQYWASIETTPGVYTYPASFTNYMSAAATAGVTPLITLDWSNPHYDYSDGQFTAPHTNNGRLGYANYAASVLNQYGSQIPAVEVWNEYNGGTFCKGPATSNKPLYYYQMLRKVHETIKPSFPNVNVVVGATVPISHGFFRGIFQNGAMPYIDTLSIHPYRAEPQGVELDIHELKELTKTHNGGQTKPIWATEFSRNTTDAPGRFAAASYLVQMATMMRIAGVERMYYYLAQEDSSFPYRGLVRHPNNAAGKYVPNPAFSAYANLIGQLTGWTPTNRIATNLKTTTYVYKFTKGSQVRHVLWAYHPTTMEISTSANLTRTDLMGVSTTLVPTAGKVTVQVNENPVFLTGNVTAFQDVANFVIADSLCDYDKIQDSKGWSYGLATLGSSDPYLMTNFQPMTWDIWNNDSYRWKKTTSNYPFATTDMMHPGGSDWAIKRWQSPMAGKIRIEGNASVGSGSTDGVAVRIFVDQVEVATEILSPGISVSFNIPEQNVVIGSKIDFAVVCMASTTNDATAIKVRIFEVPPTADLQTPTGLTAAGVADNRIQLNWSDHSTNEEGYQIEWKFGANAFVPVATLGPNATSYLHAENMATGRVYTYRVRAIASGGYSPWSDTASTTDAP